MNSDLPVPQLLTFLLCPCNIRLGDSFLFCINANTTSYISDKCSEALRKDECDDFFALYKSIPLVSGAENFLSLQGELPTRVQRFIFLALRAPHLASSQGPWHSRLLHLKGRLPRFPSLGNSYFLFHLSSHACSSWTPSHLLTTSVCLPGISTASLWPQNTAHCITVVCLCGLSFLPLGKIREDDGKHFCVALSWVTYLVPGM